VLAPLIAPVVLFSESVRIGGPDDSVIAVFSAVLYLLVLSRLWDVAASHRRALDRERVVRRAGASLASAVTVEQAATVVASAADALIGPHRQREALLAVRHDGKLRAIADANGDT